MTEEPTDWRVAVVLDRVALTKDITTLVRILEQQRVTVIVSASSREEAEVDPLDWRPPRMPTRVAVDPRWGQSLLNMEVENDSMEPEMNYAASRRTGVKRVTITFDVPLNTSFSLAVRSEVIDTIKRVLEGHGVEGENYRVVTEAKPW